MRKQEEQTKSFSQQHDQSQPPAQPNSESREHFMTLSTQSQEEEKCMYSFKDLGRKRRESASTLCRRLSFALNEEIDLSHVGKSSIVSVYSKKEDITFVSSPEDLGLRLGCYEEMEEFRDIEIEMVINKCYPDAESTAHLPQFSHLDSKEQAGLPSKDEADIFPYYANKKQQAKPTVKNTNNAIPYKGEEDINQDDFIFLLESPSDQSLKKDIETISTLLKKHQREQELSQPEQMLSAYQLFSSLVNSIDNA